MVKDEVKRLILWLRLIVPNEYETSGRISEVRLMLPDDGCPSASEKLLSHVILMLHYCAPVL